jgi:deoxyribonuclease-2
MFCCCNKYDEYNLEIALKYPQSLKYGELIDGNWVENESINDWIKIKYYRKWNNWLVYNDESPNKTAKGHCKGVLTWNNKTIGWLIHSVPKFPEYLDETGISGIEYSELKYGQSFVYIEFNIIHLNYILKQIYEMEPNIYIKSDNVPIIDSTNYYKIYPIIGEKIYHIAKSPDFEKDIYEDILMAEFGESCLVESWIRGQEIPESSKIVHVKKVNGYKSSSDHSKFAISIKSNNKWVFIGDLNRMESQKKRGGGGLLICDDSIHEAFMKIITI